MDLKLINNNKKKIDLWIVENKLSKRENVIKNVYQVVKRYVDYLIRYFRCYENSMNLVLRFQGLRLCSVKVFDPV